MRIVFIFIAFFTSSMWTSGQINYYVSPTGSNSNIGALDLPWQTIQYGLNQLDSYDTLNVQSGVYMEKIYIPASNIYLRNSSTNLPVIDATGITSQIPIVEISDKSNITISGLELRNNIQTDAQGILIEGACSGLTIKNCIIHDIHFSSNENAAVNENTNAQGIIVYGTNATSAISDLKIQNNQLYNCRLGYSEGIAVNGNVDGFEITDNVVHDLTNIGIVVIGHEGNCPDPLLDQARNGLVKNNTAHHCLSPYATCGGIYVDGGKLTTVENNTTYHNGYGIEVGCENVGKTADAIIIRNNIIYDNEICAIALGGYDYPSGSGKVTNSTFSNNSCYQNDYSLSGNGELYLSYSENSLIENNIFYTSNESILAYADLSQPGLSFDYNAFYSDAGASNLSADWNGSAYFGFASFISGSNTNSHSMFSDPQFLSPDIDAPDLHLSGASPAINAGNPNYIPAISEVDIDGESRASGIVDCGADEFYSVNDITQYFLENQIIFYPNPCSSIFTIQTSNRFENANLIIYNSNGQKIRQVNNLYGDTIKLERINLTNGIYFMQLNQAGKIISSETLIVTD